LVLLSDTRGRRSTSTIG